MTWLPQRLWSSSAGRADLALAVFVFALSALIYAGAVQLPPPFFDPLGSAAVPKLIALTLTGLAAVVVWRRLRTDDDATADDNAAGEGFPPAPVIALLSVIIVVCYVGLMHGGIVNFRQGTVLFLFALATVLSRPGLRRIAILAVIALILGVAADYLFTQVLYIDLPQKSLF